MKEWKEILISILLPVVFVWVVFGFIEWLYKDIDLEKCVYDDFQTEACIKLKQMIKNKYIKVEKIEMK